MRRLLSTLAIAVVVSVSAPGALGASLKTWKNPETGERTFKKVGVIMVLPEQPVRRTAELMFAKTASGETEVVPSHTFVKDEEFKNKEAVIARVKEGGFDGVVVMRVSAGFEKSESTTRAAIPGVMGANYAYFSTAYGFSLNDMGPLTEAVDKMVQVESLFFASADEKLVWTAQTTLKSPDPTFDVLNKVIEKFVKAMKKDKLIK